MLFTFPNILITFEKAIHIRNEATPFVKGTINLYFFLQPFANATVFETQQKIVNRKKAAYFSHSFAAF
jgi:hypothetical protein